MLRKDGNVVVLPTQLNHKRGGGNMRGKTSPRIGDACVIGASDAQGHNERIQFRIPPQIVKQMEIAVSDKRTPYRSKGELIRDAVVRHLHWVTECEPIPTVMAEVEAMLGILRDDKFHSDYMKVFDTLGEQVARHNSSGSIPEARRIVAECHARIARMPDSFWRDKYLNTLEEKFGWLLDVKGASLADLAEDD
jgi:Arc/MetJ-type ribon-helix-helix transcriptional regulator